MDFPLNRCYDTRKSVPSIGYLAMSCAFPGELQQLVQSELAKGVYANEDELLLVALMAFRERGQVFQDLKTEVQSRIGLLDRGT